MRILVQVYAHRTYYAVAYPHKTNHRILVGGDGDATERGRVRAAGRERGRQVAAADQQD